MLCALLAAVLALTLVLPCAAADFGGFTDQQEIKNILNIFPAVTRQEKKKHQRTVPKEQSKEDRTGFTTGAFHYIKFYY